MILLVLLFTFYFTLFTFSCFAANKMWWATCLTGGSAGCLDAIDGDNLTDGDSAIVAMDNSGTYEAYLYRLEDTAATEASPSVISPDTNANNKRWRLAKILTTGLSLYTTDGTLIATFPTAVPSYDNSVMSFAAGGTSAWVDLDDFATTGDLASYVPLSTFTAAGDVLVGASAGAVTKITKGSNNTFFGVNNAGTLGFHSSFNPVLVAAPGTDDTYSGTVATFTAGEALAQWDVVYCKNKSGVHACYKYDANGADKALPPRAMAVAAVDADASGTFLLNGIVRNDGWSQTTNQDEGKIVYADGATAGAITLTKSTTAADMIAILGYVVEQNVVYFNPSPILVEVP